MAEMLASSLLWRLFFGAGAFKQDFRVARPHLARKQNARMAAPAAVRVRRADARELEREALCAAERAACRAARPEGLSGRFGSLPHLALFRSLRPEQPSVFVAVL